MPSDGRLSPAGCMGQTAKGECMRRHKALEKIILNELNRLRESNDPSLGTLTKIADAVAYKRGFGSLCDKGLA